MKRNTYLFLIILFLLLIIILNPRFFPGKKSELAAGPFMPGIHIVEDGIPSDTADQYLEKTGFLLAYSNTYLQPAWVAYILTRDEAIAGTTDRTDDFREDTLLFGKGASLADYSRSGYDRGHLAPAGDMKWSDLAMSESFLLSNMSPQIPGFNRGAWNALESQVREWAVENDSLFVITGPLFTRTIDTIGPGNIPVPGHFFKILFDISPPDYKTIAFLMENRSGLGHFSQYVTSIDSIEILSGFDFFPGLPAPLQVLETSSDYSLWQ